MGESAVWGAERGWNKQVIFIPAGNPNPGGYEEYINDANDLIHFECSASHTQLPKTAHTTACMQTRRNSHNERNTKRNSKVEGVYMHKQTILFPGLLQPLSSYSVTG